MKRLGLVAFTFLVACGSKPAPTLPTDPAPGGTGPTEPVEPGEGTAPVARPAPKGTPDPNLIPREVLFGNPERAQVQLSHDGKHLAWLGAKDGVMNIFVAPVGQLDKAIAITAEKTRPVRQYSWAYDNKHVLYMQDIGGDENFHVWRAAITGGEPVDLTPAKGARAMIVGTSSTKPGSILVAMNDRDPKFFDVHAVDLATGKRTLVHENKEGFASFIADRTLELRFAEKAEPTGEVTLYARKGKAWTEWDKIPYEDADTTNLLGLDASGKTVYATESRNRDTAALVAIDVATKKPKLLAEDPKVDVGEPLLHPKTEVPQAVAFTYDKLRRQVLDKAIRADLDNLDKLAAGAEWTLNTRTLDDKHWLVAVHSDVAPAKYYLWDRAKQAGTFLFASRPNVPSDQLAKMHPVVIKARDGLELQSYLTLPRAADPDGDGKANTPVPMLLWVHGGPWARDRWGYSPAVQLFANRGYAVLQVNFRASTGFGKKFVAAGDGQWGKTMHHDLIDAVEWAVANKTAPRDKICIGGGSYGGYSTLAGLTLTPDVFACGVDIVGPSNIQTLLSTIPPYWAPMVARFKKRIGDWESADGKAALAQVSPLTHAAKIRRPLLIGQGANDPRVKEAESEQIVGAMKKHGLPVTYALFPDEGHGFARPENNIAFFAITEAFLSAHLGGRYLPITKSELEASSLQIKEGRDGIPGL